MAPVDGVRPRTSPALIDRRSEDRESRGGANPIRLQTHVKHPHSTVHSVENAPGGRRYRDVMGNLDAIASAYPLP